MAPPGIVRSTAERVAGRSSRFAKRDSAERNPAACSLASGEGKPLKAPASRSQTL